MDCLACAGACCESFTIPAADVLPPRPDARRWLELHASVTGTEPRRELTFECRCTALTPEGRCGVYAERPTVCRTYEPGGADCLATVRARRTPEQYAAIREAGDPERVHAPTLPPALQAKAARAAKFFVPLPPDEGEDLDDGF